MPAITHRAFAETPHFLFEGFGDSEDAARAALLDGLKIHRAEFSLDAEWPAEVAETATISSVSGIGERGFRACFDYGLSDPQTVESYAEDADDAQMAVVEMTKATLAAAGKMRFVDLAEVYVYPIRSGGAYRGGALGIYGEPLLDLADFDWLMTTTVEFGATGPGGSKSARFAIMPTFQNCYDTRACENIVSYFHRQYVDAGGTTPKDDALKIITGFVMAAVIGRDADASHAEHVFDDGSTMILKAQSAPTDVGLMRSRHAHVVREALAR